VAGKSTFKRGIIVLAVIGAVILAVRLLHQDAPGGRLKLPVGKGTPIVRIGERHGLILASDGSLWSWGSDFLGWPTLGLGRSNMQSTVLRRIGNDTNWVSISVESSRNVALKSDGTLWTWGEGVPVPNGGVGASYTPVPAAPGNDWKAAAAGGVHIVAIKKDGTLWGWGHNWAGSIGVPASKGSRVPLQIGTGTNWVRVWAGILESVAQQADGTLWYWGENLNPLYQQGTNVVSEPQCVSPDTNWVDAAFSDNTALAIKSDGTLWAWGRSAHRLTGVTDTNLDVVPMRVGTNSDWRSIGPSFVWWSCGLIKQDGSLWIMDVRDKPTEEQPKFHQPVRFLPVPFQGDHVAFVAGMAHGAESGVHGPIGVILTPDGEVWTWGMVLGDPPTFKNEILSRLAKLGRIFYSKIPDPEAGPVYRDRPWRLENAGSENTN